MLSRTRIARHLGRTKRRAEYAWQLRDPEYGALHRLEAARVVTYAVASTWQSRALVCAEVCRIGERMESAPTSTQAERERGYSAAYDEQERNDTRRGAKGMPSLEGT